MPACKPRCSLDTSIPGPTNLSPACSLPLQELRVLWAALCVPAAARLIFLHRVCLLHPESRLWDILVSAPRGIGHIATEVSQGLVNFKESVLGGGCQGRVVRQAHSSYSSCLRTLSWTSQAWLISSHRGFNQYGVQRPSRVVCLDTCFPGEELETHMDN